MLWRLAGASGVGHRCRDEGVRSWVSGRGCQVVGVGTWRRDLDGEALMSEGMFSRGCGGDGC